MNEKDEEDMLLASVPVIQRDLLNALEKLQSEFADAIGAPKVRKKERKKNLSQNLNLCFAIGFSISSSLNYLLEIVILNMHFVCKLVF